MTARRGRDRALPAVDRALDRFDFARPVSVTVPERFESVDLDVVRGALRGED